MVKLVNFFCLIHILRYLNTIFVSPNPVFRLNLRKDVITLLSDAWGPPCKLWFQLNAVLDSMFCQLNQICFFHIFECKPSCTSVFPFYQYISSLCSRMTSLYTLCVGGECILRIDLVSVTSMFKNFIKKDMTISFLVNLSKYVFRD